MVALRTITVRTPSAFALTFQEFIDAGFHPLATEPNHKRPGSYMNGRWFPAAGWQAFCDVAPHDALLAKMAKWPNAGIGIALGTRVAEHIVIALDFDTRVAGELAALLEAVPESPMTKVGEKGETRFYRADPSTLSKSYKIDGRGILDLLAKCRQSVMPPTRHPAGMEYTWKEGCGLKRAAELPVLTTDDFARLEGALGRLGWRGDADLAGAPSVAVCGAARAAGHDDDDPAAAHFRETNEAALANLSAWVPHLALKTLRPKHGGFEAVAEWRPSNTGRALAERRRNLSLVSSGIVDFGDGPKGYSAVDLVMAATGRTLDKATEFLRGRLGLVAESIKIRSAERQSTEDGAAQNAYVAPPPHANDDGLTWDDREANASKALEWLVKGLLPRVGVSLLWGQSGAGKSFVALHLASCILSGDAFFGHRVKAAGGTLLALGEGKGSMPDRMNALRLGTFGGEAPKHPETGEEIDPDRFPIVWKSVGDLATETNFRAFSASVRWAAAEMPKRHNVPLRLVVVDTMVASFGFKEDPDASTVTKAMKALDGLAQELGLCIVAVHHAGKSKQAGEHGSYAWRGSAETSIEVDAVRNEVNGAVTERRLYLKKNRHGGNEGWNQPFDLKPVQLGADDDGDPVTSAIIVPIGGVLNPHAAAGERMMTQGCQRFMHAFNAVFEATATAMQTEDGEPVMAVMMRDVKDEYLRQNPGAADSVRRRFDRDLGEASTGNLIVPQGERNGKIVWPADERAAVNLEPTTNEQRAA